MPRLVVSLAGDAERGLLAESKLTDDVFPYGGVRVCMALAFAAAGEGWEVELRGAVPRVLYDELEKATSFAPSVELPARAPAASDVVVVPEGWRDPLEYARLALSPARTWLFLLAPPGLFGWPFTDAGWSMPDPLTVDPVDLARPEHFHGMRALGFGLLTHSRALAATAGRAGVDCVYVGTGEPDRFEPPVGERDVDVVALIANRWAPLVEEVLPSLGDEVKVDRVDAVPNEEVLARFARAKILLWPSRVEGHATIPVEARAMGCVPVALDTNPYVAGPGEDNGMVSVASLDAIPPTVRRLLGDPGRLEELSRLGQAWARSHEDWDAFRGRVREWLAVVADPAPGKEALLLAVAELTAKATALRGERDSLAEELEVAARDLTTATENQERLAAELAWLRGRKLVSLAYRVDRRVRGR